MGNTIIKGFVKSRRTHFVYQPAIGSFYEGGQYSFKELVSARDPLVDRGARDVMEQLRQLLRPGVAAE